MMRRYRSLLLFAALTPACGGSPTIDPVANRTTSVASTSTTSTPAGLTGFHYISTNPPRDQSVYVGQSPIPLIPRSDVIGPRAFYEVTGGYNTGPGGFTGSITGRLDGTPQTGGTFTGVITANLANGCVA